MSAVESSLPPPVILTSPQCGGTHALIWFLRCLGVHLAGRHRDGFWYANTQPKREQKATFIKYGFDFPIAHGEFATGHSGPFPTDLSVLCNVRDPRNIMLCHWRRKWSRMPPLEEWFKIPLVVAQASMIPRFWDWRGDNVLRVWYEDIIEEAVQRKVAGFCGVDWKPTDFYGSSKSMTWSGKAANWEKEFNPTIVEKWNWFWYDATGQLWDQWWDQNGRGSCGTR